MHLYQKADHICAGQSLGSLSCSIDLCVCPFSAGWGAVTLGSGRLGPPRAPLSGVLALPGPLSFHINYRVLLPVENVALGAREIAPQEKHLAHRSKDRGSDPQDHSNVGKAWWPTRHLSAQEPGAGIPRASWLS